MDHQLHPDSDQRLQHKLHNCYELKDGFEHLQAHVSTSAFDSEQQGDAPKCHENTRKAVLDDLLNWILQGVVVRTAWMLWLNGAAGAGKSAIARSVVELCIKKDILAVRFFFFRTDPARNTLKPLVATLAYQLIQLVPEIYGLIIPKIQSDPLIFNQSLDTQFKKLVFEPLRQLHLESSVKRILLLILDGLDECDGHDNQTRLIGIMAKYVGTKDFPLIVLFASRAEHQLKMAFRSPSVSKILLQVPLDDHYLPDDDIRLFLNDSFAKIETTHPFSHLLDHNWPAPELVQEIVDKSSGQFIYASVVTKFISDPRLHPGQQLEIVRGLRPTGSSTPFAQLDALYRHIFSKVQDLSRTSSILAYSIIGHEVWTPAIQRFLEIPQEDIYIAMADLTSVVLCESANIRFLHASLPDFLLDQTRSQEYHISASAWSTRLSISWFEKVAAGQYKDMADSTIITFLAHAEGTADLRQSILAFHPLQSPRFSLNDYVQYLSAVQKLDFHDGGEVYRRHLDVFTRYLKERSPDKIPSLQREHDITQILVEIENDELKAKKSSRRARLKAWLKI